MKASLSLGEMVLFGLYQCVYGVLALAGSCLAPLLVKFPGRTSEGFHDYFGGLRALRGPWKSLTPPNARPSMAFSGDTPHCGDTVWVHAVSLGESLVAGALMDLLRKRRPDLALSFTTTHPDVLGLARKKHLAKACGYFPLDFLPFVFRAWKKWRPGLVLVSETDFWPGFSVACRLRGVPLALINGRISDKLCRFYSFLPALGRCVFRSFVFLGVQTESDRERLIAMGANPDSISVLGNIKVDLVPLPDPEKTRTVLAWKGEAPLIIFGSLHPSEFEELQPVFREILKHSVARILIAPRNIDHSAAWLNTLKDLPGGGASRRSALKGNVSQGQERVLILDTLGELAHLYVHAAAAFIGGTLDLHVGGHNPIEALQHDIPVIVGPHFRNFADLISDLSAHEGIAIISNSDELREILLGILREPSRHRQTIINACQVLYKHRGALEKTWQHLQRFLPPTKPGIFPRYIPNS